MSKGIETKLEVTAHGGHVISAHVSDWELSKAIPGAISRQISEAIAARFIQEHGEAIMISLLKPEFIQTELPKAVERHLYYYFTKKREEEELRGKR